MNDKHKLCINKVLPGETLKPHRIVQTPDGARAIVSPDKLWPNESKLSVLFMEGNEEQKVKVKEQAGWWETHANISFDFNDSPEADIRITFDKDLGAWSYIGTDATLVPVESATMNLGFLDGGTIAHEFGHAIGLHHEHQNPKGGIEWNEEEVLKSLSGPPNNWGRQKIRHNVLKKYSMDQVKGTEFDPESIMLYFFPDEWVKNGEGTQANEVLSAMDKTFIGGEQAYPMDVKEILSIPVINTQGVSASIGSPGEEDLFKFQVEKAGVHAVETKGQTDLILKLFGPDSKTALIATSDDDGEGVNPRVNADLEPGEYYVQVRHYNAAGGIGEYRVLVST